MSGKQRTVEARNVDFDNFFDDLSTMNLNITEAATGCCWHSDSDDDDCHHDGRVGRERRQSSSFEFGASKPSMPDMKSTMTSSSAAAHSLLDIIEGGSSPIAIESSPSIIISSQPDDECSVSTRQRSAITATNSNTLGRRRQCRGTIMTISVALLLMVSTNLLLLVFAAASAAAMEIPKGLLFASEMQPQSSHSSDSFIRGATQQPPLLKLHNEEEDDADELHHQRRLHPIHRIYRGDGARIRRKMEELENSLPYYQTGIRGDPAHELQYRNHPFDRLRRERERKMKSRRELKSREQPQQSQEQSLRRGEEFMEGNDEEHIIMEEDVVRNLEGDGTSSSTADGDSSSNASEGGEGGGEDENPFRPIRIHLDTTAIDAERTESNGAQIDFVKDIILPRMRDFWASALSVVPVSGNVVISSAELQGRLYCGDSEFSKVPTSHISVGVENTDLILYVSGAPSARFCGPTTLAVAVACNFDQVSV
jgi:hypothetical protein